MNHIRNILELSMMPLSSGVYNVYWIFPQLYTSHTVCLTVRSGAGCRREPDRSQPDQAHWARQIGGCTRAGATSSGLLLFDQNDLVTT
jgi:hypothetical protein